MCTDPRGIPSKPPPEDQPRLIDNHGRTISYLRLAITDRCNLRCSYCMPEQGVAPLSHGETLSYEELERLVRLFLEMGIEKIRITGGEPFVRRGCMDFLERLKNDHGVAQLFVTTNGVEACHYLSRLQALPISGINLSLDTMNRERFRAITRRDRLADVLKTLYGALELDIPLKVNSVVSEETGDEEIAQLGKLAESNKLSIRFIEKMPFSGEQKPTNVVDYGLAGRLAALFPGLQRSQSGNGSTAREFVVPGFAGTLGIIEGSSRKFCSTCNRIRITPQGILKVCLYDNGVLDLRDLLRKDIGDEELRASITQCLNKRFADGHQTEAANGKDQQPSMASIGG